jgi:hypothetical protein
MFAAALAGGAAVSGNQVVLEAVYGERLPATLRLPRRVIGDHSYLERRTYQGRDVAHALVRAVSKLPGFEPVSGISTRAATSGATVTLLIPFRSLEQRARAWDRLNFDPEWASIRNRARLSEVTIYRRAALFPDRLFLDRLFPDQPGGKIFDISL